MCWTCDGQLTRPGYFLPISRTAAGAAPPRRWLFIIAVNYSHMYGGHKHGKLMKWLLLLSETHGRVRSEYNMRSMSWKCSISEAKSCVISTLSCISCASSALCKCTVILSVCRQESEQNLFSTFRCRWHCWTQFTFAFLFPVCVDRVQSGLVIATHACLQSWIKNIYCQKRCALDYCTARTNLRHLQIIILFFNPNYVQAPFYSWVSHKIWLQFIKNISKATF